MQQLPEWFTLMPLDGKLTAKEVVEIFGFLNVHSLNNRLHKGHFPKPDYTWLKATKHYGSGKCKTNYWSKKVILEELKRRNLM